MNIEEERRERHREAVRRHREKRKSLGLPPRQKTDDQKARARERMRARRHAARLSGQRLPSDDWAKNNPEKHRAKTTRWREGNPEAARESWIESQARRRSTPWGAINNRLWTVMHGCVRRNSSRRSKYTDALGYLWSDLRLYIEQQFEPGMTWDNWGEVWEIDHIRPISEFRYVSLDDPLFREAWRLGNLRPLGRFENGSKWKNPA